jgi:CheY-like chemotaxis protein
MAEQTSRDPAPLVVALTQDLFFGVRIEDAIRRAGARPRLVGHGDEWAMVLAARPALALIEMGHGDAAWHEVIRGLKATPAGRDTLVVAFGSHLDTAARQAARQAGCDHVWAKSHLTEELPTLLARVVARAQEQGNGTGEGNGYDDLPSAEAVKGFQEFNHGRYFEQHETLEGAWMAEKRPVRDLYQGILQVGLACYQVEQGNWRGAVKMLRRGLPRLARLPDVCQGVQVKALREAGEAMLAELLRLGPERLHEFDRRRFPKVIWLRGAGPEA